ncbi:organomercurial lyase [Streptomyces sp. NPDC058614]|uniref:organomercurial lyase n=1 Tax=Streptomyces sp. NPDC058614 TaxID=3346557 RepID=UPI003651D2B6
MATAVTWEDTTMRITVLTVPDCPHGPPARERIDQALDGRRAEVELVEVADEAEAARFGMTGSPTILIDGVDPFAVPGVPASVSCRLYRGPDGRVEGGPRVADLQRALQVADAAADCGDLPMDAAGRAGRGRLAPTAGGLRAVQQAVLRHFAATGRAPGPGDLDDIAASHGRGAADVLAELAAEDFITVDGQGRIRAAYPFSALPTAHRVRFPDGTEVWSMCAVDALGIPAMLDTDAVITSSDPVTGDAITVIAADGQMDWAPPAAVVYVGQRPCTGSAADVACGALNFFTGRRTAHIWAGQHPDYAGKAVDQTCAEALGRAVFGSLLTQSGPA